MNHPILSGVILFSAHVAMTVLGGDYVVTVQLGETNRIDAAFVSALGSDNLVKRGRGVLWSSSEMAAYSGTITVEEGALMVSSSNDLGTSDGGTEIKSGATLVINTGSGISGSASENALSFANEDIVAGGTGDTQWGAAIFLPAGRYGQQKAFNKLTLSSAAKIIAYKDIGVSNGAIYMGGNTLTTEGVFRLSNVRFANSSGIGDIVVNSGVFTLAGSTLGGENCGDSGKTVTVKDGAAFSLVDASQLPLWNLVVEDGGILRAYGTIADAALNRWGGDVVWNSSSTESIIRTDGVTLTLKGMVAGSGCIRSTTGNLVFEKPCAISGGFDLSGSAKVFLCPPKMYSYEHAGAMIGHLNGASQINNFFQDGRVLWSYCAAGPGPQLDRSYWTQYDGTANAWASRTYLWNREMTNVNYRLRCKCQYNTYGYLDPYGVKTCVLSQKYNGSNTQMGDGLSIPAGSCVEILFATETTDSLNGGPQDYGKVLTINNVAADDGGSGWLFTTNAESAVANPIVLDALSLSAAAAIDANGMPMSVAALFGAGVVTNVTALTVSNSWTIDAEDLDEDRCLSVAGDLVFEDGAGFVMQNMRARTVRKTAYAICTADSISGFPDKATILDSDGNPWRCFLSEDGKTGYAMREHFMIIVW